jgi:hypothetical protein
VFLTDEETAFFTSDFVVKAFFLAVLVLLFISGRFDLKGEELIG